MTAWINLLAGVITIVGMLALVKAGEIWWLAGIVGAAIVFHIVTKGRYGWPKD